MSSISTHVLDTSRGRPAEGLPVQLFRQCESEWQLLVSGQTNGDGRMPALTEVGALTGGSYRMHFDTADYFTALGIPVFYPWVDVVFTLPEDTEHYHVPLLLAPFGYSTYRGS